ncbi:hypothetical protein EMCRGX_G020653 [Ephydatia muelleri]
MLHFLPFYIIGCCHGGNHVTWTRLVAMKIPQALLKAVYSFQGGDHRDAPFELQKLSALKRVHRVFRATFYYRLLPSYYSVRYTSLYGPLLKESSKFIRLNGHALPSFRGKLNDQYS